MDDWGRRPWGWNEISGLTREPGLLLRQVRHDANGARDVMRFPLSPAFRPHFAGHLFEYDQLGTPGVTRTRDLLLRSKECQKGGFPTLNPLPTLARTFCLFEQGNRVVEPLPLDNVGLSAECHH